MPSKSASSPVLTIERENKDCKFLLILSSAYITLDVFRLTAAYGLKYFNGDAYPVPQTVIIFSAEILKSVLMLIIMSISKELCNVRISLLYLIPSITYAVNNNIGLYALNYTTPPVWNVLLQMRTLFMALIYRMYFKRTFSSIQYIGLLLLMIAIAMANFQNNENKSETSAFISYNTFMTIVLAIAASALGALGPVFTEVISCIKKSIKTVIFY